MAGGSTRYEEGRQGDILRINKKIEIEVEIEKWGFRVYKNHPTIMFLGSL